MKRVASIHLACALSAIRSANRAVHPLCFRRSAAFAALCAAACLPRPLSAACNPTVEPTVCAAELIETCAAFTPPSAAGVTGAGTCSGFSFQLEGLRPGSERVHVVRTWRKDSGNEPCPPDESLPDRTKSVEPVVTWTIRSGGLVWSGAGEAASAPRTNGACRATCVFTVRGYPSTCAPSSSEYGGAAEYAETIAVSGGSRLCTTSDAHPAHQFQVVACEAFSAAVKPGGATVTGIEDGRVRVKGSAPGTGRELVVTSPCGSGSAAFDVVGLGGLELYGCGCFGPTDSDFETMEGVGDALRAVPVTVPAGYASEAQAVVSAAEDRGTAVGWFDCNQDGEMNDDEPSVSRTFPIVRLGELLVLPLEEVGNASSDCATLLSPGSTYQVTVVDGRFAAGCPVLSIVAPDALDGVSSVSAPTVEEIGRGAWRLTIPEDAADATFSLVLTDSRHTCDERRLELEIRGCSGCATCDTFGSAEPSEDGGSVAFGVGRGASGRATAPIRLRIDGTGWPSTELSRAYPDGTIRLEPSNDVLHVTFTRRGETTPRTAYELRADSDGGSRLVERRDGAVRRTVVWSGTPGNRTWETLDPRTSAPLARERRTVLSNAGRTVVARRRGDFVIETEWRDIPGFGSAVVRETVGEGADAQTTRMAHVMSGPAIGRVQSELCPDGSWVRYDYDALGRLASAAAPVGDAVPLVAADGAVTGSAGQVRCTVYGYAPVDARDDGTLSPRTARTEVVRIGSDASGWTEVLRTYRAVFAADGLRTVIEERAAAPGAAYGDAASQRTVTEYHWHDEFAGLPVRRTEPGNIVTVWAYARNADGRLVEEEMTVPASESGGIPRRTVVQRTVRDQRGDALREEEWIVTDAAGGRVRLSWRDLVRDAAGHVVRTDASDGTVTEAGWACCGPEWEIGADGVRTDWAYDAAGRKFLELRNGVAEVTDYDLAGNATGTVRRALSGPPLAESTSAGFDTAGRRIWSVSQDGIRTAWSYGTAPGGGEVRTEIRAPGTDCAVTNTTILRRDGTVAQTLLNGRAVSSSVRTALSETAYAGDFGSPRWTRTGFDLLDRSVAAARPAFGGGEIVTSNRYDAAGRLAETAEWAAGAVLRRTLYAHDALGGRTVSAQDLDLDGRIGWAGRDRIASNAVRYVCIDGDWWREESSWSSGADASDPTPVPVGSTRTRLTGLGASGPHGTLAAETVELDGRGNETVSRTWRRGAVSVRETLAPGVSLPSVEVAVRGLAATNASPSGAVVSYDYDALGRPVAATDARGNAVRYAYDANGRVASVSDAAGNVTRYGYDALGRRISTTDPLGNGVLTAYDAEGRAVSVRGAAEALDRAYDAWGDLVLLATHREEGAGGPGDGMRWLRDAATGLVTNLVYADGTCVSYAYAPDGRLLRRTDARGISTDYAYDAAGDLASVRHSDGTPSVSYARDRAGRTVLAEVAGVSSCRYLRDAHGAVTNEVQNGVAVPRALDAYGRPATAGDAAYGYDAAGRLASVSSGELAFALGYLPGTDLPAGWACGAFRRTVAYEARRDLVAAVTNAFGGRNVSSAAYGYDAAGRRTSALRGGAAHGPLAGSLDAYGYDVLSRLVSVDRTDGPAESFAYDGAGNRLASSLGTVGTAYAANALNQCVQVASGGDAFGPRYDADGNQTLVRTATGDWSVEWDAENRPVRWTDGARTLLMAYDHLGRRVRVVETEGGATNRVVAFLYDGYGCIARTEGGVTDRFVRDPSTGRPLAMVADGRAHLYAHDANGNVSALVDAGTGVVAARYAYAAFGATLVSEGPLARRNPFRFSSEYADDETGLIYYNWRHYDPVHGAWLGRDPIGVDGGANLYAFCGNRPMDQVDDLGMAVQKRESVCGSRCDTNMKEHMFKFDRQLLDDSAMQPFVWGKNPETGEKLWAAGRVEVTEKLEPVVCYRCNPQRHGGGPKYQFLVKLYVSAKIHLVSGLAVWKGRSRSPNGYLQTLAHEEIHLRNLQDKFDEITSRIDDFSNNRKPMDVFEFNEKWHGFGSFKEKLKAEWDYFNKNEEMLHKGERWKGWKESHGGKTEMLEGEW